MKNDDDLDARLDDELAKMDGPEHHARVVDWRSERDRRRTWFLRAILAAAMVGGLRAFVRSGSLVQTVIAAGIGAILISAVYGLIALFNASERRQSSEEDDDDV
jgi:hypothetical protein